MPKCCAISLNGSRKGFPCERNAGVDGRRCWQHAAKFQVDAHSVAYGELYEYGERFSVAFQTPQLMDEFDTFIQQRLQDIADVDVADSMFPYGPAIPELFMVRINAYIATHPPIRGRNARVPRAPVAQPVPPVDIEAIRAAAEEANIEVFHVNENGNLEREIFQVPLPQNPIDLIDDVFGELPPVPVVQRRRGRPRRQNAAAAVPPIVDDVLARNRARNRARAERPLEAFAMDKQNIHTTQSVNMTKQVVERVLRIPVPEEYRWNMDNVSKTAGEIITECKLTPDEMMEMLNRYIRDDDVYEMGKGIYGKVLDGVWQYICNSPDKADMCRILKQELKDNIGMCAQGNLTRLCNVLAGYMDGIGPQESVSERLGRELPLLMDDEDRVTKAKALMKSLNVPEAEWAPWLEALA